MEESKSISARSINRRYIEVNGVIGDFFLDSKKIKVKYFSTVASSNDKGSHSFDLLKELKPMRERMKASELKDLSSLLQRNLNDNRVASELIPYLLRAVPQIAFFTPVLAVLIPKDSLSANEETSYPQAQESTADNGSKVLDYNGLWKLESFKIGGVESNLGILSFNPNDVDIVVLDGQHRSNAFRVVSGTFTDKDSAVYPAFYSQIPVSSNFIADLPVTIIWFEVDDAKFDPKIVSRRLFVDVNNTAKRVSRSRTILLEETEIISSIVRFFYSALATHRSFERSKFSLFHSGFDIDSDITVSSENPFSLTNPQIFFDVVAWLALGSKRYNRLEVHEVSREAFKSSLISFGQIFSDSEFSSNDIMESDESLDNRKMVIKRQEDSEKFELQYLKNLHSTLIAFFDSFNLFKVHYKSCNIIDDWYKGTGGTMDSTEMIVWKEIFCGGEGLYYTFKDTAIEPARRETLNRFIAAIGSIESRLKSERAALLPGVEQRDLNAAFESVSTKAFQIGVLMALDMYREARTFEETYEEFYTKLNSIDEKQWVYILTVFRRRLMPRGAAPKFWPMYQKLILRLIQDESNPYYSETNFLFSPDGIIFTTNIVTSFNAWFEASDSIDVSTLDLSTVDGLIEGWITKAKSDVEELLKPIGKAIIPSSSNYLSEAEAIVTGLINKVKG